MDNNQDESQVLETETTEETTEQIVEEATAETQVEEDIEAIKAKAAKADDLEEKNKQLFARLKKQETKVDAPQDFSAKDFLALSESGVTSEDYDEVVRVAKILGKSLTEALKDTTLRSILSTRAEERKTANATQSGKAPRGTSKVSGEELLQRAERTGEVPDSDEGITQLFLARQARRLPKK